MGDLRSWSRVRGERLGVEVVLAGRRGAKAGALIAFEDGVGCFVRGMTLNSRWGSRVTFTPAYVI